MADTIPVPGEWDATKSVSGTQIAPFGCSGISESNCNFLAPKC
jgi:hypothetical protein